MPTIVQWNRVTSFAASASFRLLRALCSVVAINEAVQARVVDSTGTRNGPRQVPIVIIALQGGRIEIAHLLPEARLFGRQP